MTSDRMNLPFTGLVSFARSPVCADLEQLDADIAIIGVPSDEGSPWKPGARMAPRRIRELSVRYATYGVAVPGVYDFDEDHRYLEYEMGQRRIVDCGDVDIIYTNVDGTFDNITRDVGTILRRGALPIVIGGDHAITAGVVRAFEHDVYVFHFDAHLDFRPFVHGVTFGSGNPVRYLSQLPNVRHISQIGIRTLRMSQNDLRDARSNGNDVLSVKMLRRSGIQALLDRLPADARVYVSIDIDVLDLPLVPGCASAEPDGLQYEELRQALFAIARAREVVGFDLVEVNPMLDVASDNTSLLAAHTIIEFLGRITEHPAYRDRHPRRS